VAEIEAEMLKLARQQGYNDLPSFNEHIRKEAQFYGSSGEQLLGLYKHYTDQMYAKLPQLFGRLPKNKLEVIPMEAFRAANAVPPITQLAPVMARVPGASTSTNTTRAIACC